MDLADWLTWETAKSFGNSSFFTSFIGALAGAAGGAWAAQRIADKVKVRDQLLDEVRSCNIAIELAHGICSTFLNLKEQHVERLQEDYLAQRAIVHAHHEGLRKAPYQQGPFWISGRSICRRSGPFPSASSIFAQQCCRTCLPRRVRDPSSRCLDRASRA